MGDIQFFELPWPRDVLQGLGEQSVRLRVTLSYFIEPNPGRRGWKPSDIATPRTACAST